MNVEENFWAINPELKVVFEEEFVRMSDSSKIMWCIYLYVDPRAITAVEADDDERLFHIKKKFWDEFDPKDPFIESQIEIYSNYIPEPESVYMDLLKECRGILRFYKDIKLSASNVKDLDRAKDKIDGLSKAQSLLDKLIAKRADLQKSRSTKDSKGLAGYRPSRLESGKIGSGAS